MAAPLTSSQSSLASQLLQKSSIAIRPLLLWERACPRWRRRWFQARARWQASSYRKHRNLPPPPVGAGLPAMAALRASGRARWQASSYRKHRNLSPPPVGAGLPAMAALLSSRQSSLASQLLQTSTVTRPSFCGSGLARDDGAADFRQSSLASQLLQKGIAICPSSCGSGLARDDGAADFKAAPSDKHRYLHATFRSTCTRACPFAGHSRPAAALGFNSKPVLFYILATNP